MCVAARLHIELLTEFLPLTCPQSINIELLAECLAGR